MADMLRKSMKKLNALRTFVPGMKGSEEQHHDEQPEEQLILKTSVRRVIRESAPPDDLLLDEIPPEYFTEDFDASRFILESIPAEVTELEGINEKRTRKFQELQAVSKKLAGLVLDHHTEFVTELTRVSELQDELSQSTVVVNNSRRHLEHAQQGLKKGLQVASKYARKQRLSVILRCLRAIQTLQSAKAKLTELLTRGNLLGAIELWQECAMTVGYFKALASLGELAGTIQDTRMLIDVHLDQYMTNLVADYTQEKFLRIVEAYDLLQDPKSVLDRMSDHFLAHTGELARNTVIKFLDQKVIAGKKVKKQLKNLSAMLDRTTFPKAVISIINEFCGVMGTFAQMAEHYAARKNKGAAASSTLSPSASSAATPEPLDHAHPHAHQDMPEHDYSLVKLEHGRRRVWGDLQRQIVTLLSSPSMQSLEPVVYLRVLEYIRHFKTIGIDFAHDTAAILDEAVRVKTSSYMFNYHKETLASLHYEINKDAWQAMRISKDFNIFFLKEFAFLRKKKTEAADPKPEDTDGLHRSESELSLEGQAKEAAKEEERRKEAVAAAAAKETPPATLAEFMKRRDFFNKLREEHEKENFDAALKREEAMLNDDDALESEAVSANLLSPKKPSNKPPAPHITPTALFVVRTFGRYLQFMDAFQPLAGDMLEFITSLGDYFFRAVWTLLAAHDSRYPLGIMSGKTRMLIERLTAAAVVEDDEAKAEARREAQAQAQALGGEEGAAAEGGEEEEAVPERESKSLKERLKEVVQTVGPLKLSEDVVIDTPQSLFGLPPRVTGAESIAFLMTVFLSLKANFVKRLPEEQIPKLEEYFNKTIEAIPEIRWYMYKNMAGKLIDIDDIVSKMAAVKWDIKDIRSEHNTYVDKLIQDFKIIAGRLSSLGEARFPQVAYAGLWQELILQANLVFVEGFATAKKCSNQGRALMQLDYRQFLVKLEKLTSVKPNTELVLNYVQAFYLPEEEMESWIRKNSKLYTGKQLSALVNLMATTTIKKNKAGLLKLVETLKG